MRGDLVSTSDVLAAPGRNNEERLYSLLKMTDVRDCLVEDLTKVQRKCSRPAARKVCGATAVEVLAFGVVRVASAHITKLINCSSETSLRA